MAIFTSIAASIFGAGTFLAAAGAFALKAVAGIGLSLAAQAIAGKKKTPQADAAQQGGGFSAQGKLAAAGDIPRSFHLGYASTAGSLVYANFWGTAGNTPNAYLTQVISLSDIPVSELAEVWVNGELCTLDDTPHADYGHPVLEYRKSGTDYLWIKFYDGTQTVADSFLVGTVASADRPYESSRVGHGIAYAICTARVEDTLYTGFPSFKFALRGMPLYDPSKDDTAGGDGDQRWSTPASWGGDGDGLVAVQVYNVLRGITYGGKWFYGLQSLPGARLPVENWITQIEKCRAEITGADGPEPTYRAGGEIKVNNEVADTIEALLTAGHGRMSEIGGFYKLHVGEPASPTFVFTDDDILSTDEQSFTPFHGLDDTINGIAARYPSPAEGWNVRAAPPLYNDDFEEEDGGRRLMADVSFDLVPYDEQVQRLMSSALEEARRARRHTFSMPPKFWLVEPGDIGEWTSERNGYTSKLFRCDGVIDKTDLDVVLDLTEVDPADYDWDSETDFEPPQAGAVTFPRPAPQPIVDWFAEPATIYDADGFARRPAILLSWDGQVEDVEGIEFEVRLTATAVVVHRGRTENFAAGSIIITQSLLPETDYQARGRYIARGGRETLWSDWLSVTTPNVRMSLAEFEDGLRDYVTNQLQGAFDRINEMEQLIASVAADQDAANYLDKTSLRRTIAARDGVLGAQIDEALTVAASTEQSFASYQLSVNATLESFEASIQTNATAVATIDGKLAASWAVTLDVNGYASGLKQLNDGTTSAFVISADVFQIAWPGMSGGTPVPVFQISNVDGVAKLVFRGDMFADGMFSARMIQAGEVQAYHLSADVFTAVNANITNLTAANIRSDYAIYNKVKTLASPQTMSWTLFGDLAARSYFHIIFSEAVATVSGQFLVFAKVRMGNFIVPGSTQTFSVSVQLIDALGTIVDSFVLYANGSFATPATYNGVSGINFSYLIGSPGSFVSIRMIATWTNSGYSGPTINAQWPVAQASLLFLEPNNLA